MQGAGTVLGRRAREMCQSGCSFCILVRISSALPPEFGFCCINEKSTCSQPTPPVVLPAVARDSRNVALPGAWLELGRDTTSPGDRGGEGERTQGPSVLPCGGSLSCPACPQGWAATARPRGWRSECGQDVDPLLPCVSQEASEPPHTVR